MTKDRATSDRLVHDPKGGMNRLLEIMTRLRDPQGGCPWDLEQDFATIAPYTIEEAYEVADAIERQSWAELEGELGDRLFQTVYHAQMGAEAGHFHAGARLRLSRAETLGAGTVVVLGADLAAGERPQAVVPRNWWQAAESLGPWTLVGCTVAPGFTFEGFELAPKDWKP